jgi:ABC-2 type transport system permease protein
VISRFPYLIAFQTIVIKEVSRFLRIWLQTLLPPAVTMALYFIIFGNLIGPRIGTMAGYSYIQYIAPGIIMMAVITHSYANVVSSFFGAKFQKHLEEMLVAPIPNWIILAGFVTGGVARGICVGIAVTIVAILFTNLQLYSIFIVSIVTLMTAALFSLGGLINAIFSKKFDDITIVPTFILTPLTYLGGVFYSIDLLPEFWRAASMANPVLYMVNAFRYGLLGTSDIPITTALAIIALFTLGLAIFALILLERGVGIRS